MRNTFLDEIIKGASENRNVVLFTGDLGYGCLKKFAETHPDRYFNVGIAEQNMMSMAAGLALEGKKVFIYSIGNFNTLRCLEQIRNDVCYMGLDVNIISVGAGVEYGQLGFSHHATEDVACMRSMPNMMVFNPATKSEAYNTARIMLETSNPCYIRLNKRGIELDVKSPANLQPYMVKKGSLPIAIYANGAILAEAIKASELLENEGLSVCVVSCPTVKPINKKIFAKQLCTFEYVFSVEEHTNIGGFGGMIAEILAPIQTKKPVLNIVGINDMVASTVGDRNYLRKEYKIDAKSIVNLVKKAIKPTI